MTKSQQFEGFMQNYQNMVFSTAMRLLANPSEAEDVSQETFLRAFQHFDRLCENPAAGGWLKAVATNLSLNHLSRYRSRWSFFSDLAGGRREDAEEVEFPASDNVEAALETAERRAVIESALHSLPTTQRVPLVLYHLEDLSYEDIAEKLGVSLGKVKTDIFRGREALRKKLRLKLDPDECRPLQP
jgi:RNA polymerase sigma-70 factor, ECF subfamily